MTILETKLYAPPLRPKLIFRSSLVEKLNEGLHRKLTLISAPAGFGKTTLVSEWISANCGRPAAWLSLDKGDNDPVRFLTYFIAALQTIEANIGEGMLSMLQSLQPPSAESILAGLLNEITAIPHDFTIVLDDYHTIDTKLVDDILVFLLEHLPKQMHMVIATREDPHIPIARLRARNQLTEVRAADLRFTANEAAGFLNQVMGLNLAAEDVTLLSTRTEGWIAGLQLAAISMQGHQDTASFIRSFTGSHHFVLDYLIEEVLQQQDESIQTFLLQTSILDRMSGPLCDSVLQDQTASGQKTLEYLEHANLFIIPLDNERRWYRYHHLFAEILRQRLQQSLASSGDKGGLKIAELHIRASVWYEDNGLEIDAFQHAAAANDIERAERLSEGKGMSRNNRSAVTAILEWLASLPATVLNERPSLWAKYGAMLLVSGQTNGVKEKLDASEAALERMEFDDRTRNLVGQIATGRATLALTQYNVEAMIVQSRRALEYLDPGNLIFRSSANWVLGIAHQFQKERDAAGRAFNEAISLSRTSGDIFNSILAELGLGLVQEEENQLHMAAGTYRRVLQFLGEQPQPHASEAHLGLARILYEWNDMDAAELHGQQSLKLAQLYDKVIDRSVICEVFLARVKLTRGDVGEAEAILAHAGQFARQNNFVYRIPEIAAAQVLILLHQGDPAAAGTLAKSHNLPISEARVLLNQGDTSSALEVLEPLRLQAEARGWKDDRLRIMVLQAAALYAQGEKDKAVRLLSDALELAKPGGFIRLFVDEGILMARLLLEAANRGIMPDYTGKLLAAFDTEGQNTKNDVHLSVSQPLAEQLSQREMEILKLIAQGLSNDEIKRKLFLALPTVKCYNRNIFGKLGVQRRTEAVARARELGLL